MLRFGGATLGLLAHPPNPEQNEGRVELNFEARQALQELEENLVAAGIHVVAPTSDKGFGRQLQVESPDELLIKLNELDPELYT